MEYNMLSTPEIDHENELNDENFDQFEIKVMSDIQKKLLQYITKAEFIMQDDENVLFDKITSGSDISEKIDLLIGLYKEINKKITEEKEKARYSVLVDVAHNFYSFLTVIAQKVITEHRQAIFESCKKGKFDTTIISPLFSKVIKNGEIIEGKEIQHLNILDNITYIYISVKMALSLIDDVHCDVHRELKFTSDQYQTIIVPLLKRMLDMSKESKNPQEFRDRIIMEEICKHGFFDDDKILERFKKRKLDDFNAIKTYIYKSIEILVEHKKKTIKEEGFKKNKENKSEISGSQKESSPEKGRNYKKNQKRKQKKEQKKKEKRKIYLMRGQISNQTINPDEKNELVDKNNDVNDLMQRNDKNKKEDLKEEDKKEDVKAEKLQSSDVDLNNGKRKVRKTESDDEKEENTEKVHQMRLEKKEEETRKKTRKKMKNEESEEELKKIEDDNSFLLSDDENDKKEGQKQIKSGVNESKKSIDGTKSNKK